MACAVDMVVSGRSHARCCCWRRCPPCRFARATCARWCTRAVAQAIDSQFEFEFKGPGFFGFGGKDLLEKVGAEKPGFDISKDIPTPFPGVTLKVALKGGVELPYQFQALGHINFDLVIKFSKLYVEVRVVLHIRHEVRGSGVMGGGYGGEGVQGGYGLGVRGWMDK